MSTCGYRTPQRNFSRCSASCCVFNSTLQCYLTFRTVQRDTLCRYPHKKVWLWVSNVDHSDLVLGFKLIVRIIGMSHQTFFSCNLIAYIIIGKLGCAVNSPFGWYMKRLAAFESNIV